MTHDMALRPNALNVISVCAGGAGLDLGLELAIPSARSVVYLERESFAVATLVRAMQERVLAPAPIWSDVRTFDGRPWRGVVDLLIGGIPCQPHSHAGRKQGSLDERDLWSPTRRIIAQARPWGVLIENVGGLLIAGADEVSGAERVRGDLRKLGYSVEGGLFTATEVGIPQKRERIFILGIHDGLVDAQGVGRGEGRAEHAVRGRRPAAAVSGVALAGAGGSRRGEAEDAGAGRSDEGARTAEPARGRRPSGRVEPERGSEPLADADSDGREGAQPPRSPPGIGRRPGDGGDALALAGGGERQAGLGGSHGEAGAVIEDGADADGCGGGSRDEMADAGCAGLQGGELDGSSGCFDGGSSSRPAPELRGARSAEELADPVRGRAGAGGEPQAPYDDEGGARRRDASEPRDAGDEAVGDAASSRGRPVPEQQGRSGQADAYAHRPSSFPPGPHELDRWRDALGRSPELVPAFRRMADGVAPVLDNARIDRLRMLGNGVVPLVAGHAIRSLATALASSSRAAAQLVRMIDE